MGIGSDWLRSDSWISRRCSLPWGMGTVCHLSIRLSFIFHLSPPPPRSSSSSSSSLLSSSLLSSSYHHHHVFWLLIQSTIVKAAIQKSGLPTFSTYFLAGDGLILDEWTTNPCSYPRLKHGILSDHVVAGIVSPSRPRFNWVVAFSAQPAIQGIIAFAHQGRPNTAKAKQSIIFMLRILLVSS